MELLNYLKVLRKNFIFIAIFAVGGFAVGSLVARNTPSGYNYEQTFFVAPNKTQTENTQAAFFDFEGFYAQEKARNFTDTLTALVQTPDFKNGATLPQSSVKAQKLAPQLVKVSVTAPSVGEAKFQLERLIIQLDSKLASLGSEIKIIPTGNPVEPVLTRLDPTLISTFSTILGIALSLVIISLKSYFRL